MFSIMSLYNLTDFLSTTPMEFCSAIQHSDWQYAVLCFIYTVVWLLIAFAVFYYSVKVKNGYDKHRANPETVQPTL